MKPSLIHVAFVLFAVILLVSCSQEDEKKKPDNHILFNGSKLVITNARLWYGDLLISGTWIRMSESDNNFIVTIDTHDPTNNTSAKGRYEGVFEVVR